jgi:hypothetical protein
MIVIVVASLGIIFAATPVHAAYQSLSGLNCGNGTVRMSSQAAGYSSGAYVSHRWKAGGNWYYRYWYSDTYTWRYSAAQDSGGTNFKAIDTAAVSTNNGGIIGSANRYCLY